MRANQVIQKTLDSPGKAKKISSYIRESLQVDLKVEDPYSFYKGFHTPQGIQSKLYDFVNDVKKEKSNGRFSQASQLLEFNLKTGQYKWRKISTITQLQEAIKESEAVNGLYEKIREAKISRVRQRHLKNFKEDVFGGFGFSDDVVGLSNDISGFPVKKEFTPLIGTPFFKQQYLYDYLLAHSKSFYFKNYSGVAKNIIDTTRNFVLGKGFSVTVDDDKARAAWEAYEERSNVHQEVRNWCDELCSFGELMLKKVFTPQGILHRSIDPSTIWEIVTDPENIYDVKYYHQQYNTQYQLFGTKDAPTTKYVFNQIPPEQIIHLKVNVTSYEKRGRSDLLAALLYFNYFENYIAFKLNRAKNEAAFLWDVTVKGDDSDVQSYIQGSQSITDVPPGSENVHNEAITRNPIAPHLSAASTDDVAKWILSYIGISVNIPTNYFGTMESGGASRAGALVATEPVIRKFEERRMLIERLLGKVFDDVMIGAGLDPLKIDREFNFPELINEDRSQKIQDVVVSEQQKYISHETAANIVAKELNITTYDYEKEKVKIQNESQDKLEQSLMFSPTPGDDEPSADENDNLGGKPRAFDRGQVRQDHKNL